MVDYKSIVNVYKDRNWWDLLWNLQIAKYVTYLFANYTKITPNQVTVISFIFAVISGLAFYKDDYIAGALLFQLSYIFDIVDGALARVTNQTSKYGAFLDVFTDWFKAPILIIVLFYKLDQILLGEILMFLFFLNCCANKYNDMLFYTQQKSLTKSETVQKSLIGRYFEFMKQKRLIALPGSVEVEGIILFLYAIFHNIIFVYLALFLLVFNFVLKTYIVIKKIK